MNTGKFKISSETALKLEFQRSAGESGFESSSYEFSCTWQEKEIVEFVTRVGFLSNKFACEEMAKQFLCLYEVCLCVSQYSLIDEVRGYRAPYPLYLFNIWLPTLWYCGILNDSAVKVGRFFLSIHV